jgi:hypothetical protein
MLEDFDPNAIQDVAGARQAIIQLLNRVETLAADNRALREEIQRLRDTLNRTVFPRGRDSLNKERDRILL